MAQEYLTKYPAAAIDSAVEEIGPDKVLVVTDINVEKTVIPLLLESKVVKEAARIAIIPGEGGKNLQSVQLIWDKLEEIGATRKSLVVNIGGGVVTDLGGFAASAFKRGIATVNFPTTLLGAVDAATGGKTGINYKGLKNEIGAFHLPAKVIISPAPFASLSREEILSGYAEMIKTALISDKDFYISLLDMQEILADSNRLGEAVEKCVKIKDYVVEQDPHEKGLRKILNFGHTAGHAFESIRLERNMDITHGKAVAHGMLVALILSHLKSGFSSTELHHYKDFLKENYGSALISCKDIPEAIEKMKSDKKNKRHGEPVFTLLSSVGDPVINVIPTVEEIREALELYIDMM